MSDRTDHVEATKERNEAEAQARAERGPARMSQDAAPIADALSNFWERDTLSFVRRVSAELVTPYPPGIPALAPGEVDNAAIVDYFQGISAAGAFVEGASDQTLRTLRVVR